jgi:hypothetical protein
MAVYEARGCRGAAAKKKHDSPRSNGKRYEDQMARHWTPNPIKRARILLTKDWLRNSIRALLILLKRNALSGSARRAMRSGGVEAVRRMASL